MTARTIVLVASLVAATNAAAALPQRTFVASYGSDSSVGCAVATPCRSFATAIASVTPGGEVIALDSAGYGTFSVNQAVQIIVPPGVHAAIFASSGTAVTVNAGVNDVVTLRGLYISSNGSGSAGILFSGGAGLVVENVVVNGFASQGLYINHAADVAIRDSVFRRNGTYGVSASIASGTLTLTVERTRFTGNGGGVVAFGGNLNVLVHDSVADSNTGTGFGIQVAGMGNLGYMTLDRCDSHANQAGVASTGVTGGAPTVRVSGSTITRNTGWGVLASGGAVLSMGNNTLEDNATNNAFSGTYLPK